jgi:hypothetical protein
MSALRSLCLQAIITVASTDNPDTQKMYIPDCFRDEFARLIVEECMNIKLTYKNDQHETGWFDHRKAIHDRFEDIL